VFLIVQELEMEHVNVIQISKELIVVIVLVLIMEQIVP